MAYDLLRVGRGLGLENFSQLKGLVKGLRSSEVCKIESKFNLNKKSISAMDEFTGSISPEFREKQSLLYSLHKTFFPKVFNDSSETVLDIILKRFGENSGRVVVKGITKDDSGVVGTSVVHAAKSKNLFSIFAKANMEKSSISLSGIFDVTKKTVQDIENLVKKIKYRDMKDGRANLSVNAENLGVVRYLEAEVVAPSQYLNEVAKMVTGKSVRDNFVSIK